MNAMNPINAKEHALALYAEACESHRRQDWRQSAHALAAVLMASAAVIPEPVAPIAPPVAKRAAPKAAKAPAGLAFTMTAESLTRAMRLVCRAVERRNYMPILSQALLVATGDTLKISGTDLDREIVVTIAAPGIGEWTATADAHALKDLLGKAKGAVTLTGELNEPHTRKGAKGKDEILQASRLIVGGAVSATLRGMVPSDFPTINPETFAKMKPLKIEPAALRDALEFVRAAISTEETRYYLNGACLAPAADGLTVVATDGSRLNVLTLPGVPPGAHEAGYIVPRPAVLDMINLLDRAPAAELGISPTHVQMISGAAVLTSKLIDGNYPDFRRVIPNGTDGQWVEFDAAGLAAGLAKVAAISQEKSRSVRFTFTAGDVALSCRNMEGATSEAAVPCSYAGDGLEIAFNVAFMLDALKALGSERIRMQLQGANDPVRIESADRGADGRLCVAMPLRR